MEQAQELITSSNKTPLIKILIWMLLTISVLAAIARIATKLSMVGKLRWDDYLTTISAVSTWDEAYCDLLWGLIFVHSLRLSDKLLQYLFSAGMGSANI